MGWKARLQRKAGHVEKAMLRRVDLIQETLKILKKLWLPWLVWFSGLGAGLQTEGSLVLFPVSAHAWVAGWVPSLGACKRQPINVSHAH